MERPLARPSGRYYGYRSLSSTRVRANNDRCQWRISVQFHFVLVVGISTFIHRLLISQRFNPLPVTSQRFVPLLLSSLETPSMFVVYQDVVCTISTCYIRVFAQVWELAGLGRLHGMHVCILIGVSATYTTRWCRSHHSRRSRVRDLRRSWIMRKLKLSPCIRNRRRCKWCSVAAERCQGGLSVML